MFTLTEISDSQAQAAIRDGELPGELFENSPYAAVVLTQSWCGQWKAMKKMLNQLTPKDFSGDAAVSWLEYDLKPYFTEFMNFKEARFKNDQVPFVLYYREGKLVNQSNYVSKFSFIDNLKT